MMQKYPNLRDDDTFDIYFDGGIRSGLDVFRALALGAKFVFVGRAPMWGLYQGVRKNSHSQNKPTLSLCKM